MDWPINNTCVCPLILNCFTWPPSFWAQVNPCPILDPPQGLYHTLVFPALQESLTFCFKMDGFDAQVFVALWRHLLVKEWPVMSSGNLVCQTSCDFAFQNVFPSPSGRYAWHLMDSHVGCNWHDCCVAHMQLLLSGIQPCQLLCQQVLQLRAQGEPAGQSRFWQDAFHKCTHTHACTCTSTHVISWLIDAKPCHSCTFFDLASSELWSESRSQGSVLISLWVRLLVCLFRKLSVVGCHFLQALIWCCTSSRASSYLVSVVLHPTPWVSAWSCHPCPPYLDPFPSGLTQNQNVLGGGLLSLLESPSGATSPEVEVPSGESFQLMQKQVTCGHITRILCITWWKKRVCSATCLVNCLPGVHWMPPEWTQVSAHPSTTTAIRFQSSKKFRHLFLQKMSDQEQRRSSTEVSNKESQQDEEKWKVYTLFHLLKLFELFPFSMLNCSLQIDNWWQAAIVFLDIALDLCTHQVPTSWNWEGLDSPVCVTEHKSVPKVCSLFQVSGHCIPVDLLWVWLQKKLFLSMATPQDTSNGGVANAVLVVPVEDSNP